MIKTKSTNPILKALISDLEEKGRKENVRIWKRLAKILAKPRKNRAAVNLSKIDQYAKNGETVIVPGKVLGSGTLNKSVTVVAFDISKNAKEKIEEKGTFMDFKTLMEKNPKGSKVKIMK